MGTPEPRWDALVRQTAASNRRRRRRRRQRIMLWLLTFVTAFALLVIYQGVRIMARTPTVAAPVALSSHAPTPRRASASASPRHRASPHPKAPATTAVSGPRVSDGSSGLSYQLLSRPWRAGCPATLDTPVFSWSAGENAVAGQVTIGGSAIDWHGNACSGLLQQQFQYAGPQDLEPTAMGLVGALDPAYYTGLVHSRAVQDSSATQVSGHPAWVVKFLMSYPDAAAEGLNWTSELGAVVLVDRGTGQAPAVFYVSVPANLGVSSVSALVGSLRLS
jgi:hypothetical protein